MKLLTKNDIKNISTLPFQRQASIRQTLVNSMRKYGFLGSILMIKTSIIAGIEKLYIIDGQHRFLSGQYLGLDIPANIMDFNGTPEELVKMIATLNSTGVEWSTVDYINAYSALGNKHYLSLLKLSKETKKLSLACIIGCLGVKTLKEGSYDHTDHIQKSVLELNYVLHHIPRQPSHVIRVIYKTILNTNYDQKTFITNFNKNIETLTPLTPEEKHRIFKSWF